MPRPRSGSSATGGATPSPVNVGYNLLSGVNAPTAGTVQNSFFYNSEELDQSFYAQEQALLFHQRLTVTGGVTAERSTNDGDINRFYYYPHYSAVVPPARHAKLLR